MKAYKHAAESSFDGNGGSRIPLSAQEPGGQWRGQMGEYVLVEAVLWQAIREYQKFADSRTRRETRLFKELDQWFLENDHKWDFSFVNLCEILNLEPAYIRAGLKMWRERNIKQSEALRFPAAPRKNLSKQRRRGGAKAVLRVSISPAVARP
jgi:hypothetical protein